MSNQATIIFGTLALGLLWIGLATLLAILAARRMRLAETVLDAARHHAALLERAPARPVAVAGDGSLAADPQLLRDLGMHKAPKRLVDLAAGKAGLLSEDVDALAGGPRGGARVGASVHRQGSRPGIAAGVRGARGAGARWRAGRSDAPVVLRPQLRRGGEGAARIADEAGGDRARLAHPADRGRALSDVVSRSRPEARASSTRRSSRPSTATARPR